MALKKMKFKPKIKRKVRTSACAECITAFSSAMLLKLFNLFSHLMSSECLIKSVHLNKRPGYIQRVMLNEAVFFKRDTNTHLDENENQYLMTFLTFHAHQLPFLKH